MKKTNSIAEALYQLPPLAVILGNTLFLCAVGFGIVKLFDRITNSAFDAVGAAGILGLAGFFLGVLFLMQRQPPSEEMRSIFERARCRNEDFSFVLNPGDKAVIIGEEGNGKSTLLKWIYDPEMIENYADARGERICTGGTAGISGAGGAGIETGN